MKRIIAGILLAGRILSLPVQSEAHERQCPKPIEISKSDADLLMKVASNEALNQGEIGIRLVMSVVLNRVESPDFPDTVKEVIYQPGQFYTEDLESAEINQDVRMALTEIISGGLDPQIIAFEKTDNDALDEYFSQAFTYRAHVFYTGKID